MSPTLVLSLVAGYFAVLVVIALLTSRGATSESFFVADRNAPWYMVAFAMIGTSLSGVTFISVPGNVYGKSWSYLAVVLGYVAGYVVIGTVLLPLYYRLQLMSIYTYLDQRFGYWSYKTGALFFLISRALGSALHLYLVAASTRQHLFLISKEAVTNTARHARTATEIRVHLGRHEGKLVLEVDDNGHRDDGGGGTPHPSGMGLRNMAHRAQVLGAKLRTGPHPDGRPGYGVRLTLG